MVNNRARGLVNLHAALTTAAVGIFFWVYAAVIYHVPQVRLSREVNLTPYFLCVVAGMAFSTGALTRQAARFHLLEIGGAAELATRQVGLITLLLFAMMFATVDRSISRLFLGSFLVWSWLGLVMLHSVGPRWLARTVFRRGHRLSTLLVGNPSSAEVLRDWVARKETLGIEPVGWLANGPVAATERWPLEPESWTGRWEELERVVSERQVDQIVWWEVRAADVTVPTMIEFCDDRGCRLLIYDDLPQPATSPLVPTLEAGRHFYTLREEPLEDPLNRLLKRGCDVAIALPVVLLILPVLSAWVAWRQRRQAPGPLFHVRERRRMRGESFRMLKYRSMYARTETAVNLDEAWAEARQASSDDARIFPFGRFLRRHSLDEFPQFWNVLKGEMSVVGPRPYMPVLDEEFRRMTRGYRARHWVKPGITGLAQSLGYRGEILEQEMLHRRVQWDVYYVGHWSVWLDLQIAARTLGQVFRPPPTAY